MEHDKGLRYVGNDKEPWYGGGYCGVCGATDDLVARAVRWWDCDDGWRFGVLCEYCTEECRDRGPQADDYAVVTIEDPEERAAMIDISADIGDTDGTLSEFGD